MALGTRLGTTLSITVQLMLLTNICPTGRAQGSPDPALVGDWKLLSVDNVNPDGTRKPRHGAHPAGLLILDAKGCYSLIVLTEGNPDEYKAALEGNNADYGRYTVDKAKHAITFFMDHASHPELEGSSHTRYYSLEGDRLTYTTVQSTLGGKPQATYGEVVLERMR
jgi:hypothetical protein